MPEGDTIFRAANTLNKALGGKRIVEFRTVFPILGDLTNETITEVEAVGKHCLMHLSNGKTLRTHMRMAGSWHIYRPGEKWQRPRHQERIFIAVDGFVAVAFNVHEVELVSDLKRSVVAKLGPDLTEADFDPVEALARMRAHNHEPICDVLLNQRVMAGVGNVFKSEVLYKGRVHPLTATKDLSDEKLNELIAWSKTLMARSIAKGWRDRTIYGKVGELCPECEAPIQSMALGRDVRRTYWCPKCQRRI